MRQWSARQWAVAAGATLLVALVIAVPTAVLPTPWFGRAVPVTWWSYPTLAASAVLGGLLAATYVDARPAARPPAQRRAWLGGALTWFAVGCPVCNKIVLLALGYTGALTWFAPVQPVLAVGSVGLLGWALRGRLRGAVSCPAAQLPGGLAVRHPRDQPEWVLERVDVPRRRDQQALGPADTLRIEHPAWSDDGTDGPIPAPVPGRVAPADRPRA